MGNYVRLTLKSYNKKTGPIPVSTTVAETCPDSCPFKTGGCYAKGGPLAIVWRSVKEYGSTWSQFCLQIKSLPEGQLWRHNQAGDLPGKNHRIDSRMLRALVSANKGRRGFTYTHKPMDASNLSQVRRATREGFTINVSCNSIADLDATVAKDLGLPLVTVLPEGTPRVFETPGGTKVAVCPATYNDSISCATCGLCQHKDRKVAVGFPAHGYAKSKVGRLASAV